MGKRTSTPTVESLNAQLQKGDPNSDLFGTSKAELKAMAAGRGKPAKNAQAELDRRAHNAPIKKQIKALKASA